MRASLRLLIFTVAAVICDVNGADYEVRSHILTQDVKTLNATLLDTFPQLQVDEKKVVPQARRLLGSSAWYFPGSDTTHYFMVNPISLPASFTIELWVYPTATSGYWLSFASASNSNCMIQASSSLTLNAWQHIIMTWDGTTNRIYNNGEARTIGSYPISLACVATSGVLVLGQEQDSFGGGFSSSQASSMYLDTVAIYDVAWPESSITAKNNRSCIDLSDSTLFGAWFDGPTDRTGNGQTATIFASTTTTGSIGYCPTPQPTSGPTIAPTLLPSSSPTLLPTSHFPSALPSPVPTVYCRSGTYYNGLQCVKCDIGHYSSNNNGTAPWPGNCSLCPAGRFNTIIGSPSCEVCDMGKLSSPSRTHCKDCSAGEYNYLDEECRSCEFGKYAPQPQTGGCIYCASGSHTNNATGATTCTPCDSGSYSALGGVVTCTLCSRGTFSASGQSGCTLCSLGSFAASEGEGRCQACAAGRVSALVGASSCENCAAGSHQPSTGQTACVPCSTGKFSSEAGSLSCSSCTAAYSSREGSTRCDVANEDYFLSPSKLNDEGTPKSLPCPKEAMCRGALRAPVPRAGFWVDRSSYKYAEDVYTCPRKTCKGANSTTCWDKESYTAGKDEDGHCDTNRIQCAEGASGPLCGSCDIGYIFRSESKSCGPCEEAKVVTFVAGSIAASAMAIGLAISFGLLPVFPKFRKTTVFKFFSSFDTGSLKVIWVTYQIVMSTSFNLDITFPYPFDDLLGLLSIFSLDFLAIECFQEDVANRFFTTVYLWSVLPVIMAILISIFCAIRVSTLRSWSFAVTEEDCAIQQSKIISQHVWATLLLSYLVLPPVTSKQLQSLDCIPFEHDGSSFLRVDTGISCDDSSYEAFRALIIVFIIVYQSVPLVWMVLLYKLRDRLDPPTSGNDRLLALHVRDHDTFLDALRFLFNDYRSNKWWFEVAEMYRRIMFVGILPLTSPISATRASLGCVLAIASVAYYREEKPYRVAFTNFIAHMAQFVILITFYAALSIDTGVLVDFGLKELGMGIFLVVVNLTIVLLTVWLGWIRFKRHRNSEELLHAKASNIESANGFTADKFRSTFDVISQTTLSAASMLVFHYTTLKLAKLARESGLPALEKYGGVALTLRHPHEMTKSDREAFQTEITDTLVCLDDCIPGCPFEAVLAISLPKRMLETLPGFEADPCLCMISVPVLQAMRPTSFVAVLNAMPWLSGLVLLPPTCLIRSFSLVETSHVNDEDPDFRRKKEYPMSWVRESDSMALHQKVSLVRPVSASEYLAQMKRIRSRADELGVSPLFHFTNQNVVAMILEGGIRMSTQGQGDGGCYFSTLGPASMKLGKPLYELNIIRECFGIHRAEEFSTQAKLDAVIIYGCCPMTLSKAPGGRDNARMVTRSAFQDLSLPHNNGSFFLRPTMILGALLIECNRPPVVNKVTQEDLENEALRDEMVVQELANFELRMKMNRERIDQAFHHLKNSVARKSFSTGDSSAIFGSESGGGRLSLTERNPLNSEVELIEPSNGEVELMPPQQKHLENAILPGVSEAEDVDLAGDDDAWEELRDENTRKSYFWNRQSGETRWEPPSETRLSTNVRTST